MITKRVSEDERRRIFNDGRYYERMKIGEFRQVTVYERLRKSGDRRIRNTMIQIVDYRDRFGNTLARVHQFRRRDGMIGASGLPDPKSIFHEGVLYTIDESEQWDLLRWYED